jgi:hypothetical protein
MTEPTEPIEETEPMDLNKEAREALLWRNSKGASDPLAISFAQACATLSIAENLAYMADEISGSIDHMNNMLDDHWTRLAGNMR